jgi:hypothetical protein
MARPHTENVMKLTRGAVAETFGYDEWVCVRCMWSSTIDARSGPVTRLFSSPDRGEIAMTEVLPALRAIVRAANEHVLSSELDQSMGNGSASSSELFELAKKVWKVPYKHITDSSESVKQGTKKLGALGAPGIPAPTKLGELERFRSAFEKLVRLTAHDAGDASDVLAYEVLAPLYLANRR